MRVLQINTVCGFSSTGRTSAELAQVLLEKGHECYVAYGQGTTTFANAYKIGTRLENHAHNLGSRLLGKQGYFTKGGTKRLVQLIGRLHPDIIHLRNLHGNYLNLDILFGFLAESATPVIWTLHDCWAFTGKCAHYSAISCYKWKELCNRCPQYRKYPPSFFFDCSERMYQDKKRWFTSIQNMTLVPVSDWLAGEVRQSFLAKYPIARIYNWIDRNVFAPCGSEAARTIRRRYGLADDAFVVLGVSASWSDRKGSSSADRVHDFALLSQRLRPPMQLVMLGAAKSRSSIPKNGVHIPYVHDLAELAAIYNMADVYVHLSREDTFGKVIAEALACGIPAVVYNSTACPEVVGEGCGHVAEAGNVDQVYEFLGKIQQAGKQAYSSQCVSFVDANFDLRKNTEAHMALYRKVLER